MKKVQVKKQRDRLEVFREFLEMLERAAKRRAAPKQRKPVKGKRR